MQIFYAHLKSGSLSVIIRRTATHHGTQLSSSGGPISSRLIHPPLCVTEHVHVAKTPTYVTCFVLYVPCKTVSLNKMIIKFRASSGSDYAGTLWQNCESSFSPEAWRQELSARDANKLPSTRAFDESELGYSRGLARVCDGM